MKKIRLQMLCTLLLWGAMSIATPAAQAQSPDAQAGKAAFDARCSRCHQIGRLQGYLAKRPDDAARTADLDRFLTRHHASDAAERAAIIAWMLTQQAAPAP